MRLADTAPEYQQQGIGTIPTDDMQCFSVVQLMMVTTCGLAVIALRNIIRERLKVKAFSVPVSGTSLADLTVALIPYINSLDSSVVSIAHLDASHVSGVA